MKKKILLVIQICIFFSFSIAICQIKDETVQNLKEELQKQKLIDSLQAEIQLLTDKSTPLKPGISMGVGYFTGILDEPLVGRARIDENGIVRVLDERKRITRLFPTITGLFSPLYKSKTLSNLFVGLTLGVNDGVSNEGSGFAMAIGGTIGFTISDIANFGFFAGFVYDPSVTILPDGFIEGKEAPEGYGPNSVIETKNINARYLSTGFVFSISL